jgi:hypothetical protein
MARQVVAARCNHSGPPCHKCIRSNLLNEVLARIASMGRNWHTDVDQAEKDAIHEVIDVKVDASVIANGGYEKVIGIRVNSILPQIHDIAELEYRESLRRGIEKSTAKENALVVVRNQLEVIFERYDRQQAINVELKNDRRQERLARRAEIRGASHHVRAIPGGPAAAEHAELQEVLARVGNSDVSENIMDMCASSQYEGVNIQLIVSRPSEDNTVFYRVFSKHPHRQNEELDLGSGSFG